jgi:hypothetical protein
VTTPLDRDGWSFQRCQDCRRRPAQLTIDRTPLRRSGGTYRLYCWLCYWASQRWREGPIVNCGPVWDGLDIKRQVES